MINLDDYDFFRTNKKSLKELSKDDSNIGDVKYMTESPVVAVDFDGVKRSYVNSLGLSEDNAASVDGISCTADTIAFIEFKNGSVNKGNCAISAFPDIYFKAFRADGKKEFILFDLERYKKLYFKDVHTYSQEEFEAYLIELES